MLAKVQLTVKTHKNGGEVVCRAIHAYNNCSMLPGMRWMTKLLHPTLSQLPHLLVNSADFMRKTTNLRLPSACRFMKLDIKDFYMSGSHKDLVSYSSLAVDPSVRDDYILLASAILESQYVTSDALPGAFKVCSGAGMGMLASGHVPDSAFYYMVEKPWALDCEYQKKVWPVLLFKVQG